MGVQVKFSSASSECNSGVCVDSGAPCKCETSASRSVSGSAGVASPLLVCEHCGESQGEAVLASVPKCAVHAGEVEDADCRLSRRNADTCAGR